jgi:PleD family two-component response regulator
VNLSIGVATGEKDGLLTEVFKQADQAMYEEKENKRNIKEVQVLNRDSN